MQGGNLTKRANLTIPKLFTIIFYPVNGPGHN